MSTFIVSALFIGTLALKIAFYNNFEKYSRK